MVGFLLTVIILPTEIIEYYQYVFNPGTFVRCKLKKHCGRSKSLRKQVVNKFRKGEIY